MSGEERKPILYDSGIYIKQGGSGNMNQSGQQHLIIQPIEFDHKHRNLYGYFAFGAFLLVLVSYLMIKERTCQISLVNGFQNFDLIQSFHMTVLIVAIIVFVLSYFNFALVIYEVKLLFYVSAATIFICAGLLIYNVVAITSAPCVPLTPGFGDAAANGTVPLIQLFGTPITLNGGTNIFSARDGIGITVFIFDLLAAGFMFFAGRRFYQKT